MELGLHQLSTIFKLFYSTYVALLLHLHLYLLPPRIPTEDATFVNKGRGYQLPSEQSAQSHWFIEYKIEHMISLDCKLGLAGQAADLGTQSWTLGGGGLAGLA